MSELYVRIYIPDHHRAHKNGLVYEHIIKAEEKLNRKLKEGEVVHHMNGNKKDNRHKNLIVFKTTSDHSIFHKSDHSQLIKNKDGSWSCKRKENLYCDYCDKEITNRHNKRYCSEECMHIDQRKVERPCAEQLKKDLMETNFVQVGKKYGVTDGEIGRASCRERV